MKKGAALIVLLAALLTTKAHAPTKSNESNDEGWMSSTLATASHAENSSESSAVSSDSVVVNWSSICTDLCGAGFGGTLCGKHCQSGNQLAPFRLDNGTDSDSVNLCPVLCEFHLGGRKCECISMRQRAHTPKNAHEFCSIFCIHYNTSINGCSKCSLNVPKTGGKDFPPKSDSTTTSIADAHSNGTESIVSTTETTSVAAAAATTTTAAAAAAESTEIPTTTITTITEQTETTITTISSATSVSPMEHEPPSTTPDWHMVCVDLCKKGEGGVLCNCDLPPLLIKRN